MAIAYVFGHVLGNGVPKLASLSAEEWLPVAVVPAALVIAALEAVFPISRATMMQLWLLIPSSVPFVLLRLLVPHELSTAGLFLWSGIVGGLAAGHFYSCHVLHQRVPGPSFLFAVCLVTIATGGCLGMAGSATIVPAVMAMATGLGICGLVWSMRRHTPQDTNSGAVAVTLTMLFGLWTFAYVYLELDLGVTVLLVLALPVAWLAETAPIRKRRPWQIAIVRCGIVACLSAGALTVSTFKFVRAMNESPW